MKHVDCEGMLEELLGNVARIQARDEINELLTAIENKLHQMEANDPVRGKMVAKIFREEYVRLVNKRLGPYVNNEESEE